MYIRVKDRKAEAYSFLKLLMSLLEPSDVQRDIDFQNEAILEYIRLSMELGQDLNKCYQKINELSKCATNSYETQFYLKKCEIEILNELANYEANKQNSKLMDENVIELKRLEFDKKSRDNLDQEMQALLGSGQINSAQLILEGKLAHADYLKSRYGYYSILGNLSNIIY